jgi:hypothetical protein
MTGRTIAFFGGLLLGIIGYQASGWWALVPASVGWFIGVALQLVRRGRA